MYQHFINQVAIKVREPEDEYKKTTEKLPAKLDDIFEPTIKIRVFYFRALRSLVVLSFPQLLSFSSVFPKPLSEPAEGARTEGIR